MKRILFFRVLLICTIMLAACSTCEHTWDAWKVSVEATCTEEGVMYSTCAKCGEEKTERTPKTEHTLDGNACGELLCHICGAATTVEHDFAVQSEKAATLLTAGSTTYRCSRCKTRETREIPILDPATLDMPIVYITETEATATPILQLAKAHGEVTVQYKYVSNTDEIEDFEVYCKLKIQGDSSTQYPKKNFTVKFYKDEACTDKKKVDLGWGKESKYCMKANYIDASHARNIVGARLFAETVASREHIAAGLQGAPNYGVIDGYPILVYLNGEFHGLYTMNMPKDEWMLGMEGDESTREAALMSDGWEKQNYLRKEIINSFEVHKYDLEYCSTTDDAWVKESFNELIALLNCGDNERIKRELSEHLDIEAAIDNMLFTYFIAARDNYAKHLFFLTYDGKVWSPTVYDMDSTFGSSWDGTPVSDNGFKPRPYNANIGWAGNQLYEVLIRVFPDDVDSRYRELRQTIFTTEHVQELFDAYMSQIPRVAYLSDWERWPDIPYTDINLTNMGDAINKQIEQLDEVLWDLSKY